jgi:hypothetical protein
VSQVRRTALVLLGVAMACSQRDSITESPAVDEPRAIGRGVFNASVHCIANVAVETLSCPAGRVSDIESGPQLLIVGGQGVYVQLASQNVSYDPATQVFQADVTVQNLMGQPLGTPDGSAVTGVRVFFHTGPSVTGGAGAVSVSNADGTDSFTGANQPFHEYAEILEPGAVSTGKTWEWQASPDITFQFEVYVQGDVQHSAAVTVSPQDWVMPVGETVQFTAEVAGVTNQAVSWSVNDIPGGNAEFGTISGAGTYTAPSSIPAGGSVSIKARSIVDPRGSDEAPVTVTSIPPESRLLWYLWTPRAITDGETDSATYEVVFSGYPRFSLELKGGQVRELMPARSNTYSLRLGEAELLAGYQTGDLHNFVGYVLCNGCARVSRGNLFVNVKDETVPTISGTAVTSDIQVASHIVNIKYDSLFLAGSVPREVLQTFYASFSDDFDFVAIVEQVNSFNNRTYRSVRNEIQGLGLSLFDHGADYGSAQRLQGIVDYPITFFFDAGEKTLVHEVGHRWMAFLRNPSLTGAIPHWPISDMAVGIMGFSNPISKQGQEFRYTVSHVSGSVYRLDCADPARELNDLELYLMGLLPSDSVSTYVVFDNQAIPLTCGSTGTATPITIGDITSYNGARVPDYTQSLKTFKLAAIILSKDRLLSSSELSFFNHMAERGEATTELRFTSGFVSGMTKPFYLATGGRATLTTRIQQ